MEGCFFLVFSGQFIGRNPVQRNSIIFEFDMRFANMIIQHRSSVSNVCEDTTCPALAGNVGSMSSSLITQNSALKTQHLSIPFGNAFKCLLNCPHDFSRKYQINVIGSCGGRCLGCACRVFGAKVPSKRPCGEHEGLWYTWATGRYLVRRQLFGLLFGRKPL